jgi:hypothetical protein
VSASVDSYTEEFGIETSGVLLCYCVCGLGDFLNFFSNKFLRK